MSDNPRTSLEQQLALTGPYVAPSELRAPVLAAVHRQLVAQRWDLRLARLTVALLVLGFGLNATVNWQGEQSKSAVVVAKTNPEAIVEVALAVAQATDAETGRRVAEHLAAFSGAAVTPAQSATIDQHLRRRFKSETFGQKDG